MQYRVFAILVMTVLAVASAAASEAVIEDVLVTGTFAPQPALTASVSVLDSSQIQALNKTTVADLLKTLPGLLVEKQGGPGGLTAVSIRGGEANFTLVLIDGVAVNDPTNFRGGGFDFANLNPNMVDRIEVVRGAQSAIYGSDALAGVINIITRRPQEGHQQQVSVEGGQDDYSDVGASALGSVGAFTYTVELASRDDGEPTPGSTRDSDSAHLRLGWRPSSAQELSISYRYLDGKRSSYPEQSGGPRYALYDALDNSKYTQDIIAFDWGAQLSADWRSTLTANRFEQDEHYCSPGIPPYFEVPPNGADTDFTRDQLRWINTVQLAPGYEANIGAEYRHEEGKSDGYIEFFGDSLPSDFELDRDTRSAFADISASPLADLLLHASLRYDDPEEFDSETSGQFGARYAVGGGVTLAANWGEAYKLPSFFALGHALVGNPELQPEKGESWDLGATWQAHETLMLNATWFENDFRDLVDFDDETFRNVNRKNVQTSGVELQADWRPLPALSLRSQGTYTDIDVRNEDTVLTGRPEWTASVVAQWQIREQWDTALDYLYAGKAWSASRHTGELVNEKLGDYHRVDWVLRWQLARAWQIQASVDNVLDENYETAVGFSGPGREFRLGVTFSN
ncbi:MAG: TonB-dependent receptor [Halioglobus sp.]|nr:TonB-dependent receptor [Halioglobus sp.]